MRETASVIHSRSIGTVHDGQHNGKLRDEAGELLPDLRKGCRCTFPRSVQTMQSYFPSILLACLALQACGPIHPRWKNQATHDIAVTYWRGTSDFGVRIKRGREAVPPDPFDFQSVERIEIKDQGRLFRFDKPVIARLHEECGHGYGCWISYDDSHELHVSTSNPAGLKG
ncbi:hypothetical protein [Sphingobium yanoikuyae]|uniref:hypothetical protein n=1 Tax=Sphingobium yanoikuyae TaxID=13690 RepID=UPI0035B3DE6E